MKRSKAEYRSRISRREMRQVDLLVIAMMLNRWRGLQSVGLGIRCLKLKRFARSDLFTESSTDDRSCMVFLNQLEFNN